MQGIALQNGLGTRYVYSVPRAEIKKFSVERWCGDNPQGQPDAGKNDDGIPDDQIACTWWQYTAFELPVESDVSDFVHRMRTAYQAYGNSFQGFEDVHFSEIRQFINRSGEINAYSFVRDSAIQTQVLRPLNDVLDQRNNPHTLMSLMRPSLSFQHQGLGVNFTQQDRTGLRTRITFDDGSEVHAKIEDNRADYAPGSARDANGALIPDYSHRPGGANEHRLIGHHNASDADGWLTWANLLGIQVETQGSTSVFSCGQVNGGAIRCVRM